jgi:hypothetical protein
MKTIRFLLALLTVYFLVSCAPVQEQETATAEPPTAQPTAVILPTETAAPATSTTETTPTPETAATDTAVPPTATSESTATPTATAEPTLTPTLAAPPITGQIAFFWDPDPYTLDGPHPPETDNLYLAMPGTTPDDWYIEVVLTDAVIEGPAIFPSPDKSKLALLLWDDTNGDGRLDTRLLTDGRNIFIFNLADHSINQLTNNQDAMFTLSWSLNGQTITYPQDADIYTIGLDGSPAALVVSASPLCPPGYCDVHKLAQSSDGNLLAFNLIPSSGGYLYVFNRLTNNFSLIGQVGRLDVIDWPADSNWLALFPLFAVDVNTLVLLEIKEPDDRTTMPSWSFDSQWLAFTRNLTVLSLWNPATLSTTDIFSASYVGTPVWSTGGLELAVGVLQEGQPKILLIDVGNNQTEGLLLPAAMQQVEVFAWSPHQEWLLFFAEQNDTTGLYVIHRDGGEPHLIMDTTGGSVPEDPVWLR